jgi:hypothetical protein
MSDSTSPKRDVRPSGSHFQPSLSVVLIIVVLFVGATFLMVRSVSPTTSTTVTIPTVAIGTTTTTAPKHVVVKKSQVRVQVANGTEVQGLAAHFTQILMTHDWDTLPPGNGPHVTSTIVYYNPGFRDDGLQIAGLIKVAAAYVLPLNGLNPIAGSSSDDVIVVLGPNSAIG